MRLIDADKIADFVCSVCGDICDDEFKNRGCIERQFIEECAKKMPTVDAVPVRHGHWIDVNGDGSLWRCSVCGETQCCESNYCGDCGAKMDEVTEDAD